MTIFTEKQQQQKEKKKPVCTLTSTYYRKLDFVS